MSGRKNTLLKFQSITAADGSADITGAITNIQFLDNIGIQINQSDSTMTGVFYVQVSADYAQDSQGVVTNQGNWINIISQAVTAGSPNPIYFDINQISAPWIRLFYDAGSGSGTVDAFITAKMV